MVLHRPAPGDQIVAADRRHASFIGRATMSMPCNWGSDHYRDQRNRRDSNRVADMDIPGPASSPLVDATELAELLALEVPSRPVVLDVRYPGIRSTADGHGQYRAAHLPGAVYVSLDKALAAPHKPGVTGRHPLPLPEAFQAAMRVAGVGADRPVIVYDDWLSIAAARAWWLLRWAGHRDVRVLDGGWGAWLATGGQVEDGDVMPEPGDLVVEPGGRTVIDAEGAARIAASGVLLDARPINRYRGQDETIDPVAGHIPGARSLPARSLITDDGFFLPASELTERFVAAGVQAAVATGIYCASGIQACHAALAAEICGVVTDPAIYVGSWSDWITDPRRPIELG